MAGPYYSDLRTKERAALTGISNGITNGDDKSGLLLKATAIYTLLGTEAATELIELVTLPAGCVVEPALCSVVCADPGTTLTVDVGDDGSGGNDTADPDRYADGIVLSAGGEVKFNSAAVAAAIAGPLSGLPLLGAGIEFVIRKLIGTKAFASNVSPFDKVIGQMVTDKGINSAIWKALEKEAPLTVQEILSAAVRDSANVAQLVGVIDPRAAIVPATARALRDTAGILGNAADLVMEDTPEDKAAAIVAEEAKLDKKGTAERTTRNKALAKELAGLPEDQRARRIASLDKTTRTAVESRLRRHQLTPAELSLSNLSTERRSAAIKRILDTIPERERPAYLDRLRSLRLLPKGFTE